MTAFLIACSIASVFSAMFAFRFRTWNRPRLLLGYFLSFLILEWIGTTYVLPPKVPADVLGIETAMVCFGLTAVIIVAIFLLQKAERGARRDN